MRRIVLAAALALSVARGGFAAAALLVLGAVWSSWRVRASRQRSDR